MNATIAIASAALLVSVAGQAAAQTPSGPPTVSVSYAGIDLSHPSGRALLERRVAAAIERVCPDRPVLAQLRAGQAYDLCIKTATISARRQLASVYARDSRPAGPEIASSK